MPDKRTHRGPHPDDERLFAPTFHDPLRAGVADLSWLLTRGYALISALKLTGDRHQLTTRQRMAVRRSACSDWSLAQRRNTRVEATGLAGQHIAIDGYNVLITVESALSGGLVIVGRDGGHRDLASVHGTYRRVCETEIAVRLIYDAVRDRGATRMDWYLDRPVSNSGRLRGMILDVVHDSAAPSTPLHVELVAQVDRALAAHRGTVATTDSVILDGCTRWIDLAGDIIGAHVRTAWCLDLGGAP